MIKPMDSVESFIRRIPKTETHLHIEGALPYDLLVELDDSRFPSQPFFRERAYKYPDFVNFETLLIDHAVQWFDSAERYHVACKRMFESMASLNVKYVETSFHLHMVEFIGVDGRDILSAIKSAVPEGMEVRVIGGMVRNGYTEVMKPIIETLHQWDELDGIDLHGQEWLDLEEWAPPVWRRCADAGKIIKAHAGEFGGPDKVYEAIDVLGSRRIQHGVRAVEDEKLVARLAEENCVLDVCPLSNEKLGVFPSLEDHSLRRLIDAGIPCTISTDDPLCFANDIVDEYIALHSRLGFSKEELAQLAKNGFVHARMSESKKSQYIAEIDAALTQ
ncbi:adenosine deaminase family protein [Pelagicoccus sp. SDUM812003]|uniref:adenosine deaminase family protein n=1 Tax=Pelagicoccus sp. SDUM812003 TaxID=3041267 RepID=UPI00280F44F5|nr:adenosine deaminase family protein [Pelagicoccus sp. SDUM812003]MDQ8201994.1 adenosine deaminase family protein [Pelagicoccus sp. SDUM812003]